MTTLKTFLDSNGITPKQLLVASRRMDETTREARAILLKRAQKRANKESAGKSYAELGIAKPNVAGRGLSDAAVAVALAGKPQSRKVRAKFLRAVNVILTKKKQAPVEMKALFEGVPMRVGKAPKKDAAKKK